jgi:hypothetical protein
MQPILNKYISIKGQPCFFKTPSNGHTLGPRVLSVLAEFSLFVEVTQDDSGVLMHLQERMLGSLKWVRTPLCYTAFNTCKCCKNGVTWGPSGFGGTHLCGGQIEVYRISRTTSQRNAARGWKSIICWHVGIRLTTNVNTVQSTRHF